MTIIIETLQNRVRGEHMREILKLLWSLLRTNLMFIAIPTLLCAKRFNSQPSVRNLGVILTTFNCFCNKTNQL